MNRNGQCRMCERVTEFREVVFHGSAYLECIPCGDMIPYAALVEMPTERLMAAAAQQANAMNSMRYQDQAALARQMGVQQANVSAREIALYQQANAQQASVNQYRVTDCTTTDCTTNVVPTKAEELDAARKRIAELEVTVEAARSRCEYLKAAADTHLACCHTWSERNNRLGDEAGALRTELTHVKAELYDALRKLEAAERKAGKR
jgi:hypothetical protein